MDRKQLITVVPRSIWKCRQTHHYYIVSSLTPRMATLHPCDVLGRRRAGFTLKVRQSSLKRDYRLENVV